MRRYEEAEPQRVNRWLAQSGVCSRREADALIAEGLVSIGARKLLETAESPEAAKAMKEELAAGLRPHVRVDRAAALGMLDDVIDPRDTRKVLSMALARSANKTVDRPWRRREVPPF